MEKKLPRKEKIKFIKAFGRSEYFFQKFFLQQKSLPSAYRNTKFQKPIYFKMKRKEFNPDLFLVLKGEWYDMIEKFIKTEEYRDITNYWAKRFISNGTYNQYKTVTFQHGYSKTARRMTFEFKGISVKEGKSDWGAKPGLIYFVIELGLKISHRVYTEGKGFTTIECY